MLASRRLSVSASMLLLTCLVLGCQSKLVPAKEPNAEQFNKEESKIKDEATQRCESPSESLNAGGPPMIRQIILHENIKSATGPARSGNLAFGTHCDGPWQTKSGEAQEAIAGTQQIRIILDEIVRGNSLEEIGCSDGSYSRIPTGTTPDDLANKVCIVDGKPIGVHLGPDGSHDRLRMIDYNEDPKIVELAVQIVCDGVPIPMSQEGSFWSPSGNQSISDDSELSYFEIGPAIVLVPAKGTALPSKTDCKVVFRPEVVDYEGNSVCANTGGSIDPPCRSGDTSKISFRSTFL